MDIALIITIKAYQSRNSFNLREKKNPAFQKFSILPDQNVFFFLKDIERN